MENRRKARLDSLLREVLVEVIRDSVKDLRVHPMTTVTRVDVTRDLENATVYLSILTEDPIAREQTLAALADSSRFISHTAMKQVNLFHFPKLIFRIDEELKNIAKMDSLFASLKNLPKSKQDDKELEEQEDGNTP